jgi:hypothetical protein
MTDKQKEDVAQLVSFFSTRAPKPLAEGAKKRAAQATADNFHRLGQ